MTATIEIDGQSFDPAREHFAFPSYHRIADMAELEKLRLLGRLTSATFGGTNLDDRGLHHVAAVSTIDNLDLQDTKISNDGLAELARMPRLRYLRLKENRQLTTDCIPHLLRLEALTELAIHETSIDQAGVNQLVALRHLERLCIDVWKNNYSFDALLELSVRMPRCEILAKDRGVFSAGEFELAGNWMRRV